MEAVFASVSFTTDFKSLRRNLVRNLGRGAGPQGRAEGKEAGHQWEVQDMGYRVGPGMGCGLAEERCYDELCNPGQVTTLSVSFSFFLSEIMGWDCSGPSSTKDFKNRFISCTRK